MIKPKKFKQLSISNINMALFTLHGNLQRIQFCTKSSPLFGKNSD